MSVTPFGSNPHLLSETSQKTTRAALNALDGLSDRNEDAMEVEVKLLENLVQHSLGSFDFSPPSAKRREVNTNPTDDEGNLGAVHFRLVSSILPPHRISLLPPYSQSIPHQRPCEDTTRESRLRHKRAQEIAVDIDWVLMHSRLKKSQPVTRTLIPRSSDMSPSQLPSLIVTERPRPTINLLVPREEQGSARVKCCLVVPVTDSTSQDPSPKQNQKQKRKQKRKRGAPPRERSPPHFFRPVQQLGGKSAGYAMGWRSSWPAHGPGPYRYSRDKMNKGITLAQFERTQMG